MNRNEFPHLNYAHAQASTQYTSTVRIGALQINSTCAWFCTRTMQRTESIPYCLAGMIHASGFAGYPTISTVQVHNSLRLSTQARYNYASHNICSRRQHTYKARATLCHNHNARASVAKNVCAWDKFASDCCKGTQQGNTLDLVQLQRCRQSTVHIIFRHKRNTHIRLASLLIHKRRNRERST